MEQPPQYVAQENQVCLLRKAIYGLKQSPCAWFEKFSSIVVTCGFRRYAVDHSVFYRQTDKGCVILTVYVDDILLTDSDVTCIQRTKDYLQKHFVTKDMGRPKYFLGIEFAYTKDRMTLSQRKYALDLLQETDFLRCKLETTQFDQSFDFWDSFSPSLEDAGRYKRLIGKLIYLTVTHPDIAYIVGILSQFM